MVFHDPRRRRRVTEDATASTSPQTTPEPPPSPLEPRVGDDGYVTTVELIESLKRCLRNASYWLTADHDRITSSAQARVALREARRLVDVIQRRLTTDVPVDASPDDQGAAEDDPRR